MVVLLNGAKNGRMRILLHILVKWACSILASEVTALLLKWPVQALFLDLSVEVW